MYSNNVEIYWLINKMQESYFGFNELKIRNYRDATLRPELPEKI